MNQTYNFYQKIREEKKVSFAAPSRWNLHLWLAASCPFIRSQTLHESLQARGENRRGEPRQPLQSALAAYRRHSPLRSRLTGRRFLVDFFRRVEFYATRCVESGGPCYHSLGLISPVDLVLLSNCHIGDELNSSWALESRCLPGSAIIALQGDVLSTTCVYETMFKNVMTLVRLDVRIWLSWLTRLCSSFFLHNSHQSLANTAVSSRFITFV